MSRVVKAPWTDKFQQPTVAQLREAMPREVAAMFDVVRERLMGVGDLEERVAWQGVPWRWTLIYAPHRHGARGALSASVRAWAYLIPDPNNLQLCVTLTTEQIQAMEVRRLKKWVRDGIAFARAVGGVCWPTYTLGAGVHVEDLLELLDRKARACAEEPQAISA